MKKLYITFAIIVSSIISFSQCFVQVTQNNVLCNGSCTGAAFTFPFGTSPFTYSWNTVPVQTTPNITGLCIGTYIVTMTDAGGCSATNSVTITEPPVLTVTLSSTPASCGSCADGTATATPGGGAPPYTYLWTPTSQTTASATGLSSGVYTVCVTDVNGCVTCNNTTVTFIAGINDPQASGNISIHPNPSSQFVSVGYEFNAAVVSEITFTNILGEKLFSESIAQSKFVRKTIPVDKLPAGIYFISVKSEQGISVRKFIKQ